MNAIAPDTAFHVERSVAVSQIVGARALSPRPLSAGQIDALHATGADAVERLLPVLTGEFKVTGPVWEPACGDGAIARVLTAAGHEVIASDVADHGFGRVGVDFLKERRPLARTIWTNPPFGDAGGERFFGHAMRLLRRMPADRARPRRLILLHRARFLETRPRDALFEIPEFRLAVFLARDRTAMMHRAGHAGKKLAKSPEFYAWLIWDLDRPRRPGEHAQMVRV